MKLVLDKYSLFAKIMPSFWLLSLPKYGSFRCFVSKTIQYNTIQYNTIQYLSFNYIPIRRRDARSCVSSVPHILCNGTPITEYGTRQPDLLLKSSEQGMNRSVLYTEPSEHGLSNSEHSLTFPEHVLNCLFLVISSLFQVPKRPFLGMNISEHVGLPNIIGWQASPYVNHLLLTLKYTSLCQIMFLTAMPSLIFGRQV